MNQAWLQLCLAIVLVVGGCAAPPMQAVRTDGETAIKTATMTIDVQQAVEALGNRPNSVWQDSLFNTEPVRERRRTSPYHIQTANSANTWSSASVTLPSASTNGMAYAHNTTSFGNQNPNPGEKIYVVTDSGTVRRLDPASNGATITPDWTPLTGITGVGNVTRSAVGLSSNNGLIYLLTTGGFLVVVRTSDGTRLGYVKLSSAGFSGIAPYIDYSQGGIAWGQADTLYALSRDGSLYRCQITNTAINIRGWRSRNGGANGVDAAALTTTIGANAGTLTIANQGISYVDLAAAGVTTTTFCVASPVVWNGEAFYGGSNGRFYRLKTASGAADSVIASNYPIETTPAFEFNASMSNIQDLFVPAGDRLHWLDASGATLTRKATSPPLVLDKKPASLTAGTSGRLSNYNYTTTNQITSSYNASDWTAACTTDVASDIGPTRWGGGAADLGAVTLTSSPFGLAYNAADDSIWATQPGNNRLVKIDGSSQAIAATYDGNGNYAALVKTVPTGGGSVPNGLAPDPINGGVWVTCYGTSELKLIDAGGTVTRTITGVPNPTGIYYDTVGTASAADDILWVTSTTGTGAAPTGALQKVMVSNGARTQFTNADTDAGAKRFTNPGHNAAVANATQSNITSASWAFRGPQGVAKDAYGRIWVANSWEAMEPTNCNFCPDAGLTPGYPFNVDGHGTPDQANSSILVFDPTNNKFKAQVICTGAPYNMEPYDTTTTKSMWAATYRWGVDTTSRFNVTSNLFAADSFKKIYESWQNTGDHWQPHWVAVDTPNNQVWIVNGDANTAFFGTAGAGLDRIKASAAHTATPTSNNAGMRTTNPDYLGTYQTGAQPRGVAIDSNGNCWVANASNQSCTKYSSDGTPLGTYPVGNTPWCVACDKFNVTWVCNRTDNTVSRITAATMPPAPLSGPRGLALDSNQNLWIANSSDSTLTILDQTGNTVYLKLPTGTTPNSVEVGPGGTVWVASTGQANARKFTIVAPPTSPLSVSVTPANNANWCAVTPLGNGFISVPSSNHVVNVTAAGVLGTTISTGNNSSPRGIDIDPTNSNTWIANQGTDTLAYIPFGGTAATTYTVGDGPTAVAVKNNIVWAANTSANTLTRMNAKTGGGRAAVGVAMETVSGFNGANQPGPMAIDADDNLWVANTNSTNKVSKIWFAGAQDLMATENYKGTDGNDSYMYFRIPIASGNFGGRTPVSANLKLTARSASGMASETMKAFLTTPDLGGALWGGFNGANNVDWDNKPTVGTQLGSWSGAVAVNTVASMPVGNVNTPLPGVFDFPNMTLDNSNGLMAYAAQSASSNLQDVAHWSTATRPQLEVTLTNARLTATSGMKSQPTIDSLNQRIYVMSSNVLCEVRYDSPANFADPTKIAYSYTKQGLSTGTGPLTGNNYITPSGLAFMTTANRLAVLDYDGSANAGVSCFQVTYSPLGTGHMLDTSGNNSTQLTRTYTLPATGGLSNTQAIYDYEQGSVYIASGTSVYAFRLLQ